MNIPREQKEKLNALSKEVFGSSSRWQKLVERGYAKTVTVKTKETIPGEKEGDAPTEREVEVPQKLNGMVHAKIEHHTVESITEYMTERKKQLDLIRAEIKRQQDEARAKREQEQLAKKVHEELQGSAV